MRKAEPTEVLPGVGRGFLRFVATPWWRAVWVGGAIVWFLVFVALVGASRDYALALAALGAVPLVTVSFDIARRRRALRSQ
jgi:hypothetical protein